MRREDLQKYAQLALKVGLNLQRDQVLVVGYGNRQVFPEHVEFARIITEVAYDMGAKFVQIDWGDEHWFRETVARGDLKTLEERYRWQAQWVEQLATQGAAYLALPASNPDLFKGVDSRRVGAAERMNREIYQPFTRRRTNEEYSWSLLSVPTQSWADKVFPNLPESQRVEALWEAILFCSRALGADPVQEWTDHIARLRKRADALNQLNFRKLHYTGSGTDLWIEFHPEHFWKAALNKTPEGIEYVPNMPTEEVFTAPMKTGVNGVVKSTMPLNHGGALIEGLELRFEGGRIVEYKADSGLEALRSIVETDEGSHYLGEVALVPVNSPIAERNILFYNTLFDENASCHLAIGMAYPLIQGGRDLARDEWEGQGLNDSLVHVDFMIGSPELNIEAELADGKTVPIMQQGRFVNSL
ncbi:aminopeptidase [Alicyclobacillus mengziensis]|uniref:Aminopeptidase n=1 Tax=Alicyclobacillus mengziensis TaxID=2931921 RepID=A0A9X7VXT5_9BACL|nr:aminopeptidase [Alicyclobacillus mengziensis]QSO46837.1 aminopeptidase [Alicyclobacillus mengziensis]